NLFQVIRGLAAEGCAIGIVSHHMHEVFEISDEITVLRDGEKVAHLETADTTPGEVIRLMVGRDFKVGEKGDRDSVGEVALNVEGLSGPGFEDVNFSVRRGEIFGLAGLVGAGRSEVTRSIFGIAPVYGGKVQLDGELVKPIRTSAAIKQGLALVPVDRSAHVLFPGRATRDATSLMQS